MSRFPFVLALAVILFGIMTATAATLLEIEGGTVSETELPGEFEEEGEEGAVGPSPIPTRLEKDDGPARMGVESEPTVAPTPEPTPRVDPALTPSPTPSPAPEPTPRPEPTPTPQPEQSPTPGPTPLSSPDG